MHQAPAFNTAEPLAYLLTWTTYGTWLPGDDRGWNRRGQSANQPPNPLLASDAIHRMKEPEFRVDPEQRQVVDAIIERHCAVRGWTLHARNVRSNHIHVLITSNGHPPDRAIEQFKSWSTRGLKKILPGRQRFWTEGGSCRYINTLEALEMAMRYVQDGQDR